MYTSQAIKLVCELTISIMTSGLYSLYSRRRRIDTREAYNENHRVSPDLFFQCDDCDHKNMMNVDKWKSISNCCVNHSNLDSCKIVMLTGTGRGCSDSV